MKDIIQWSVWVCMVTSKFLGLLERNILAKQSRLCLSALKWIELICDVDEISLSLWGVFCKGVDTRKDEIWFCTKDLLVSCKVVVAWKRSYNDQFATITSMVNANFSVLCKRNILVKPSRLGLSALIWKDDPEMHRAYLRLDEISHSLWGDFCKGVKRRKDEILTLHKGYVGIL